MDWRTARIRALNDELRQKGRGGATVMTSGIAALPDYARTAVMTAVGSFEHFNTANDPHGERDFAVLYVAGVRVMFKIDYYDLALAGHSHDPTNPEVTRRVLTIMLAEEY
jgi:hypothetical protein